MRIILLLLAYLLLSCQNVHSAAKNKGEENEFVQGLALSWLVLKQSASVDDHPRGQELLNIAHRLQLAWPNRTQYFTIRIIKAPMANAFALPGGFVFVTAQLLDMNLNADELAFLLGHEFAHIQLDHFQRLQSDRTKKSVLASLASLAVQVLAAEQAMKDRERLLRQGTWARHDDMTPASKTNQVLAPVLIPQIVAVLSSLRMQRSLEREADIKGAAMALRAGYSPWAGSGLMDKLAVSSYRDASQLAWQTHPLLNDRKLWVQTKEELQALEAPVAIDDAQIVAFRQSSAMELLHQHDLLATAPMPDWMRSQNIKIKDLQLLLLDYSRWIGVGDWMELQAGAVELKDHLLPEAEHQSLLFGDFGRMQQLLGISGNLLQLDDKQKTYITSQAEEALPYLLAQTVDDKGGRALYEHLLKNYPNHKDADEWEFQVWSLDDHEQRMLDDEENYRKHLGYKNVLESLVSKTESLCSYLQVKKILQMQVDTNSFEKMLGKLDHLEKIKDIRDRFDAKEEWYVKLLKREKELVEDRIREAQLAIHSDRPDMAVQILQPVILYASEGPETDRARSLISRVNRLSEEN